MNTGRFHQILGLLGQFNARDVAVAAEKGSGTSVTSKLLRIFVFSTEESLSCAVLDVIGLLKKLRGVSRVSTLKVSH